MSSERMNSVFVLILVSATLMSTLAQKKPKLRGPSQFEEREDFQKTVRKNEPDKTILQSPFTPPQAFVGREFATKRTETIQTSTTTTTTTPLVVVDTKIAHSIQEAQVPNAGSPFSPPAKSEWREQHQPQANGGTRKQPPTPTGKSSSWLNSVEERQRENINSIPPLAYIDLNDKEGSTTNNKRHLKGRPKTSTNPEKGHKDIHDAEPGVTPWTRYTDKPRVKEEQGTGSGKATARCGRGKQRYNPRKQICCEGRVVRRHGVSPACCKGESYDTVFNKCCDGVISVRTNGQSDC